MRAAAAMRRKVRTGLTQVLGLALLAGLLSLRIWDPAAVETLRNQSFDLYQRILPRPYRAAPVAIVDIDEKSLAALGQWPWPRTRMAQLVDAIAAGGAPAMAFDIVFAEADRLTPESIVAALPDLPEQARNALRAMPATDAAFARAMARTRVVLGQTSVRSATDNRAEKAKMVDVAFAYLGPDPTPHMLAFPDVLQNRPELRAAAAGRGVFTVRPDADGIFRKVPLVMTVQGKPRLSLAPELLRVATGGDAFAVKSDEAGISGVVLARKLVPTDRTGTVWPWFTPHRPERFVSAIDVLEGRAGARLAGHLVLVGTSAVGLEDFRPTPMGVAMAGVEIHAQVLENMLQETMLWRPHYAVGMELMVAALLGLLVIVLLPRLGARWSIAITGVLLAGYLGTSAYAFAQGRLLLDPSFPLLATTAVLIVTATGNYLREENERKAIRSAFGQYVSPALVDQLADEPDRLGLGGETKELSVLFSDVRGFTALSETFKRDPEGLTQLMNRFLNVMSGAILDEGGTIDKFMGDAVMAFWNAPLDKPDHARASCRAAIAMIDAVAALNAERRHDPQDKAPPIDIGIGINTGQCIVGNMGSDARFDYTALGDTVNISSRLEGQSKTYGVRIVLGDATAARVADLAVIELDLIRVKGRTEPERIHALLGGADLAGSPAFEELRVLNQALLSSYRGQEWDAVLDAVGDLREQDLADDLGLATHLDLYEARALEFRDNPPGTAWDGVYTATSK